MSKMNPSVDGYLRKNKRWQPEMAKLRSIVLDCELTEEMKWRVPCYTLEGNNVILISAFKEYCALSFFKGVLLEDAHRILVQPGENTQSGRLVKFTSVEAIDELEATLKAYVLEAIELEKAGAKVEFKKITEFPIPSELQLRFEEQPALRDAFEALTPGRQRAYLLQFAAPKQSKTRMARIDKWAPHILDGKGLNDE